MPSKKSSKASAKSKAVEEPVKPEQVSEPEPEPEPEQEHWEASSHSESENDNPRQNHTGRQSIVKFDREAVRKLDKDKLSGISNVELLRVLMVRGEDELNPNPRLKFGSRDLLKNLAGERIVRRRPFGDRPFSGDRLFGDRPGGRGLGSRRDDNEGGEREGRPFQRRY